MDFTSLKNKKIRDYKENQNRFEEFKCIIKKDKAKGYGFLCDFRYLDQKELVPTIITFKDYFPEDFEFKEENEYIIIRNDFKEFKTNLKIIFMSDNYNIVIFKILNSNDFPYLNVINNFSGIKNNFFSILLLKRGKIEFLICSSKYYIKEEGDFFKYYNKNENILFGEAFVLDKKDNIIGITMGKNENKGIMIGGIIKEIKEMKTNINRKNDFSNSNIKKRNSANKSDTECIYKIKNENKNNSNNSYTREGSSIISINNNRSNKENKENSNLKSKDKYKNDKNSKDKTISFVANNNHNIKKEESKHKKSITNSKVDKDGSKNENNIKKFEGKGQESGKEINLYFLFKNGKELYLDVKESFIFKQVIEQLNDKYLWLKDIGIKEYRINNKKISENKSVKDNKLKDNDTVVIIEFP